MADKKPDQLSRRSMMMAAGAAGAALASGVTAASADSCERTAVKTYKSADFYDAEGTFLKDKALEAYHDMFRRFHYPLSETLKEGMWTFDFGLNDFANVGMAGIFWINEVGTYGASRTRWRRFTVANSRIMGAALGNIMAIIMIHHMRNMTRNRPGVQVIGMTMSGSIPFMSMSMPAPAASQAQDRAVTAASAATTTRRSLRTAAATRSGTAGGPGLWRAPELS